MLVDPDGCVSRLLARRNFVKSAAITHPAKQYAPGSQICCTGGTVAVLLHSLSVHQAVMQDCCLIQAGAFLPKDPKYADILSSCMVKTPTLFVFGEQDQLIPPERTQQLMDTFDSAFTQQYQHSGGHMVPTCTGSFKQALQKFVDKHGAI